MESQTNNQNIYNSPQVVPQPLPIETPPGESVTQLSSSEGGPKIKFPKIERKFLFLFLGVLILISIGFLVNSLFFSKKEAQKKEVTLTYWGLWEDQASISQLISEYKVQNPNITINYIKQAKEDYRERLVSVQTKGNGPDIFRFHNTWVPMFSSQLTTIPSNIYDANLFQSSFYPVATRDLQQESGIVGIPLMYDGLALYINDSIFTAEQKTAPTTWDELRKTAKELTVKDEEGRIQQAGVALGRTENVDHWEDIVSLMMLQNRVDMKNPTSKLAQDALSFYTVFATEDLVWDETMPPSTQAFAGGKLAMYFAPSWRAFEIKQQNPNLSFKVVPVPQLPKNNLTDSDIAWASYWVEGVWNKSPNKEEAWKFLKFLSEKNSQQKLHTNVAQARLFGPIYSRVDMANLLNDNPYIGAYVKQAPKALSWYLASRTFDGSTGINSRLSQYYKDAINSVVIEGRDVEDVLQTLSLGISQVLGSYQTINK